MYCSAGKTGIVKFNSKFTEQNRTDISKTLFLVPVGKLMIHCRCQAWFALNKQTNQNQPTQNPKPKQNQKLKLTFFTFCGFFIRRHFLMSISVVFTQPGCKDMIIVLLRSSQSVCYFTFLKYTISSCPKFFPEVSFPQIMLAKQESAYTRSWHLSIKSTYSELWHEMEISQLSGEFVLGRISQSG